jgi:hypothetical protein
MFEAEEALLALGLFGSRRSNFLDHREPPSNPTPLGPAAAGYRRGDQFADTRRSRVSSGLVPRRTGGPHVPVPVLT